MKSPMQGMLALAVLAWGHGPGHGAAGPTMAQGSDAGPPTFTVGTGRLRVELCADDIVRVAFAWDEAFFTRPSLMAAPR
jgi:hypothetical protein